MTLVFDSNDGAHKTNIQATETSFLLSLYFLPHYYYPKQSLDLARRQITTLTATYQHTDIDSLHSLAKKNEDLL
jgi:hypothetical protein